jgi:hypothetical protein
MDWVGRRKMKGGGRRNNVSSQHAEVSGKDEGYPCRLMLATNELILGNKQDDDVMGANWCILIVTSNVILTIVFNHTQQNLELQWKIPYIIAMKVVDC